MKNPSFSLITVITTSFILRVHSAPEKIADKKVIARQLPKSQPKSGMKSAPAVAFVRVLHAAPNGSKVDVYNGSLKIAAGFGFKSIGDYIKVRSGKSTIKVVSTSQAAPAIATDSFSFVKGKHYTLALYGKYTPTLLSINESTGREMPEKARVRVIYLAIGAPTVLVTIPSDRNENGYTKFLAKSLDYGSKASKSVRPDTIRLQIRTLEAKLIGEAPDFNFQASKRYSVFIVGQVGDKGKNALDFLVRTAIK